MMEHIVRLLEQALMLERMATLVLAAIGCAVVWTIAYKIPPMIGDCLKSVSQSLERISVTMAELVMTSTRICNETATHTTFQTIHHENALSIKEIIVAQGETIDEIKTTTNRIETKLDSRPCLK